MLSTWSSTLIPFSVGSMCGNEPARQRHVERHRPRARLRVVVVRLGVFLRARAAIRCRLPLDAVPQRPSACCRGRSGLAARFSSCDRSTRFDLGQGERERDRVGIGAGAVDRRGRRLGVVRDLPELRAVRETVDARAEPLVPVRSCRPGDRRRSRARPDRGRACRRTSRLPASAAPRRGFRCRRRAG